MKPLQRNSSLLVVAGIAFVALGAGGCSSSLTPPSDGTGGSAAGTTGEGGSVPGNPGTGGVISSTGGNGPGGAGGAGGIPPAACTVAKSGEVPSDHRATAPACNPSTNQPPVPDGGVSSCTADTDCTANTSSLYRYCVHGTCAFDQCLTDTDCGSTGVCACSSDYYGGNGAYHSNVCVPANCRLDSDCGPGGYCSASRGYCGTFQGFYCHTAADTCIDATSDCAGCGNACVYSPAVGAFTCGSSICAG